MIGKIKCVKDKGFGFIIPDGKDGDIFFHASGVSKDVFFNDLAEGQLVDFDTMENAKGLCAINIKLI